MTEKNFDTLQLGEWYMSRCGQQIYLITDISENGVSFSDSIICWYKGGNFYNNLVEFKNDLVTHLPNFDPKKTKISLTWTQYTTENKIKIGDRHVDELNRVWERFRGAWVFENCFVWDNITGKVLQCPLVEPVPKDPCIESVTFYGYLADTGFEYWCTNDAENLKKLLYFDGTHKTKQEWVEE